MDTPYLLMFLAFLISGAISFNGGYYGASILVPSISAGLFVSFRALTDLTWFVGLFLMAAIPYAVISYVGAETGRALRSRLHERPTAKQWVGVAIILLALGVVGTLFHNSNTKSKWEAIAQTSAKEFAITQPQVRSRIGSVRTASLDTKTSVNGYHLPYSSFTYYIRGSEGSIKAVVGVSGTISAPQFSLVSLEASR